MFVELSSKYIHNYSGKGAWHQVWANHCSSDLVEIPCLLEFLLNKIDRLMTKKNSRLRFLYNKWFFCRPPPKVCEKVWNKFEKSIIYFCFRHDDLKKIQMLCINYFFIQKIVNLATKLHNLVFLLKHNFLL